MGKITRHGGPSVREFQSPAYVLRQRGKLGPYGGEARVEEFTQVSEAAAVPNHPAASVQAPSGDEVVETDPALGGGGPSGAGSEPKTAEVRAWAREHGYEVPERGKVSQELIDAYKAAHEQA